MVFRYRMLREWICEHCSIFKILTQTVMLVMLIRTFCLFFFVVVVKYG